MTPLQSIRLGRALALLLLGTPAVAKCQRPLDSVAVRRLEVLGRVWATEEFFGVPDERTPDLDSAVARSAEAVSNATSEENFRATIASLITGLRDGTSSVRPVEDPTSPNSSSNSPLSVSSVGPDSALVLRFTPIASVAQADREVDELTRVQARAANARAMVIDLRAPAGVPARGYLEYAWVASQFESTLSPDTLQALPQIRRTYTGWVSQASGGSRSYERSRETIAGRIIYPLRGVRRKHVVFIVNQASELPSAAFALRATGQAAIVAADSFSMASLAGYATVPIDEGFEAHIQVARPVPAAGGSVSADCVVPSSDSEDRAMAVATRWIATHDFDAQCAQVRPASPDAMRELSLFRAYRDMRSPTFGYRLLGLYRLWATLRYFDPHTRRADTNWDRLLAAEIPRFAAATDSVSYAFAVEDVLVHLRDGHAFSPSLQVARALGAAPPDASMRIVDGKPIVTAVSAETKGVGLYVGDEVLSVDGVAAADRTRWLRSVIPASNPVAQGYYAALYFLCGPDSSLAKIRVRGADRRVREVHLRRSFSYWRPSDRSGPPVRLLAGGSWYVDLARVTPTHLNRALDTMDLTHGVVFDARGANLGTGELLGRRFAPAGRTVVARLTVPIVRSPDDAIQGMQTQTQAIETSLSPRVRPTMLVLVDETTQSSSEHLALYLRAAGAQIIGSQTAGADGNISSFYLPGGVRVSFTGMDVATPDGHSVQGAGVPLDYVVPMHVADVRTGRDPALIRAQALLRRNAR